MGDDLRDMIEQLKLERKKLRNGGSERSARGPAGVDQLFRDSATCLNVGLTERRHSCSDCLLWEFVPKENLQEDIPCHYIPLNAARETIAALEQKGDRDAAEEALREWLDRTIAQLEEELARRPTAPPA